ncbi:hypothetical protein ABIA39_000633 [Nocardia sp. GAS34]|uniref:hypothetical protein n=1 Tax=unclassified Nocardia TaxID=2637762 RepID=UPI003D1EE0C5
MPSCDPGGLCAPRYPARRINQAVPGNPERLAALLRAQAHGAADLAAAGHLAADGKGRADPADLVDDLLGYLPAAIRRA